MVNAPPTAERVLIYRLGSLGDTVVALPCFHLIERCFPHAERRVLTGLPISGKAAPLESVLGSSGLIHGAFHQKIGERDPAKLWSLRGMIANWKPEFLVYLAGPRGPLAIRRDLLFFRLCGIKQTVGAPLTPELRKHLEISSGLWEPEAARLARCLASLGDAQLDRPESWDLRITTAERDAANAALTGWPGASAFVTLCIGTKYDVNDWGDERWHAALRALGERYPALGLVTIGVAEEAARSARVIEAWKGPRLNLCGRLAPRESAALLGRAKLYLGHDSGPMHLAAAVGTRVVAVFSARIQPGVWFPHGTGHYAAYHRTPCFNCYLAKCEQFGKVCINSIAPKEVVEAADTALRDTP